ncbi:MAG TPA: pitrilysin family protein [Candidatus Nanoarchaeia archaeon]|nr:pitrilysin family protein [Candidatus Nanoarchaeia archaeon]
MQFLRRKLKNGMTVIMEQRELPVVSFSITNRFGAIFEESKIKGIAHFMEHLLFTGTKTRTHEDISREIEKKGGILNAFTAQEVTSYWFKLPSEHLFAGMDILCDMFLHCAFKEDKFEKEKKVILEEIKMYHDSPQSHVFELIERNLYKAPFGEGIIGSATTVSALDRDFVAAYYKEHYSPEQYIVTIVGNADFETVCRYLEERFSGKKGSLKELVVVPHVKESVEERAGIDQAHFVFALHAPLAGTKEHTALEVLDAYLASGMSSRLFLKIREEKGLAYAVKSSLSAEKRYAYYSIYVGTTKQAVPEVTKIILEEFKAVEKMSEKDLAEAKERLIGLRKVTSEESSNVMNELLFAELRGRAEDYYEQEARIKEIRLEDVQQIARIKDFASAAIVPV